MGLDASDIEGAVRGNPQSLRRVLTKIASGVTETASHVGFEVSKGVAPLPEGQQIQPPQPGRISVVGGGGHYQVTIVPSLPSVDRRSGDIPAFRGGALPGDPWGSQDGRRSRALSTMRVNDARRNNPNLIHSVQAATSLLFDAASGLITLGPSPALFYDYKISGVTMFWRFQSRFQNSPFGPFVYFTNNSGPIAVVSG